MKIKYTGKNWYDNEYLSTYRIGFIPFTELRSIRDKYIQGYFDTQNKGRLHHLMMRDYLRAHHHTLAEWIRECNISFGAYFSGNITGGEACLLFIPGSPEELAFRLCFDVRVETE